MSTQGSAKRRATQATDNPVKRTRVSRACDQCRIAREKCNGTQPTCSTCSTSRRACTYTAAVKKRGIQPGYIRALELALAYLFQHDPENETLINDKLSHGGTSSLLLSRDSRESNKLHKRWRKARFYTDVDKLLSGGEPSRHDQSEPLSPDSDEEHSNTEEPSSVATTHGRNLRQAQDRHVSRQLELRTSTPAQQPSTRGPRISMPLDSWRLLEVYFTYTQCWLPICSKHDILKLSYSYPIEGLALSLDLPDIGLHAELWSVLAVASLQEPIGSGPVSLQNQDCMTPAQLYATARSLIPEEVGLFDLGHVKALLNLAIFNIAHSSMKAAWLLVAYASRILDTMDQALLVINPRYKHAFHGCFMLDTLLALHFDRCPYFRIEEVRQLGRVDEDGLDEWQPWSRGSHLSSGQQSRTPILALSTFNAMMDIVGLLSSDEGQDQDKFQRLKAWEFSLPPKLAYICATTPPVTLTPPAILLQLTYYCIALALTSSQSWLLRSLNLLEQAQDQLGWKSLPPVLRCLLNFINRRSTATISSHEIQSRLQKLQAAMSTAWPKHRYEMQQPLSTSRATHLEQPNTAVQVQTPLSITQPLHQPAIGDSTFAAPSPFDPALSEPRAIGPSIPNSDIHQDVPMPVQLDPRYPEIPSDLESFFDELASLDSANNLDNQPQFMQNLGFAPDANMADLFSEYIPLQSSAFMTQENAESVNLDHYGFYGS